MLLQLQKILKKMKLIKRFAVAILILCSTSVYALTFDMPTNGNVVGEAKTAVVREEEDFSDIAQRFDVGYYEVFEANPGVDPDNPAPNTTLIIPTQYILPPELNHNIVVNIAEMRLYYQPQNSNKIYIYPIGIGKEGWGTPTGKLKIASKTVNPTWVAPESIYKFRQSIGDPIPHEIKAGPDNPLGKYRLRLSNPVYAIHGTIEPAGIGRRTSSGCIRLYPADIEALFNMVQVGTKVVIVNKPYKVGFINNKLYLEAHMPLAEQRLLIGNDTTPATKIVENYMSKNPSISVDWHKVTQVTEEHLCVPRVVGSYS